MREKRSISHIQVTHSFLEQNTNDLCKKHGSFCFLDKALKCQKWINSMIKPKDRMKSLIARLEMPDILSFKDLPEHGRSKHLERKSVLWRLAILFSKTGRPFLPTIEFFVVRKRKFVLPCSSLFDAIQEKLLGKCSSNSAHVSSNTSLQIPKQKPLADRF